MKHIKKFGDLSEGKENKKFFVPIIDTMDKVRAILDEYYDDDLSFSKDGKAIFIDDLVKLNDKLENFCEKYESGS